MLCLLFAAYKRAAFKKAFPERLYAIIVDYRQPKHVSFVRSIYKEDVRGLSYIILCRFRYNKNVNNSAGIFVALVVLLIFVIKVVFIAELLLNKNNALEQMGIKIKAHIAQHPKNS